MSTYVCMHLNTFIFELLVFIGMFVFLCITLCSNKIIGDAEYKFAADFQQQDAFGRKELVKAKPEQVRIYIYIYWQ